jgi:hypothetical protein
LLAVKPFCLTTLFFGDTDDKGLVQNACGDATRASTIERVSAHQPPNVPACINHRIQKWHGYKTTPR